MITPTPRGTRVSRRTLLGLGIGLGVGVAGLGPMPTARAAEVAVGRFAFDVPATIRAEQTPRPGWQWEGRQTEGGAPSIIVLARADLAAANPHEVLGLLLAAAAGGWLPELSVDQPRDGTTRDGAPALRQPISYQPAPKLTYRGSLLITRDRDAAAILAVIGTSRLTAGRTDEILDSAGWSS